MHTRLSLARRCEIEELGHSGLGGGLGHVKVSMACGSVTISWLFVYSELCIALG